MEQRQVERKLAAILVADVAGFSRLMGLDEEGTLTRLRAIRQDLVDPTINEYHGRIFKTTGDGVLAEFASVVDAVRCGAALQIHLASRNADVPQAARIEYRIGINLGDIIVEGDDIFGDGVNVAARLEALAEPGGLCISASAYEQVRDKVGFEFRDIGEQTVKNIARPVRAFTVRLGTEGTAQRARAAPAANRRTRVAIGAAAAAILLAVGAAYWWKSAQPTHSPDVATVAALQPTDSRLAPTLPDKPSIAVLAFNNMSDDAKQDYFSDGISEDLITDLSKISGLFVIARNSSFVYKGKAVSIAQVSQELGVRYVLEGSVRKAGEQVRITAQLIDGKTGAHVWAERYDRQMRDIFALQDDVRKSIVAALAVKLTPNEERRLAQQPTNDPEAYDLYTRGLQFESFFTPEANLEARRMFEKAIERDPKFAAAYSRQAISYSLEARLQGGDNAMLFAKAISLAQQAMRLDPELPQAHWALGISYMFQRQLDRAIVEMDRAIALDTNFADAYALRGSMAVFSGQAEVAIAETDKAQRINPHYPFWYLTNMGQAQFHLGHYQAAVDILKRALDRNPNWAGSRYALAAAYVKLGMLDDAKWQIDELRAAGIEASISMADKANPYQDAAYRTDVLDSLRKIGLPEQ